jgi:hypothetical protein
MTLAEVGQRYRKKEPSPHSTAVNSAEHVWFILSWCPWNHQILDTMVYCSSDMQVLWGSLCTQISCVSFLIFTQ